MRPIGERARRTAPVRAVALLLACVLAFPAVAVPGGPLFDGFIDDTGHAVREPPESGHFRLVVLGYTHCPDVCPLTLVAIHRALESLGAAAAAVEPVFVTVDPERDTVAVLHRHVRAFDARLRAFRGDHAHLDRLCAQLALHYWREPPPPGRSDYGMSHSALLVLLAADGTTAARIRFDEDPAVLAQAIVAAVRGVVP